MNTILLICYIFIQQWLNDSSEGLCYTRPTQGCGVRLRQLIQDQTGFWFSCRNHLWGWTPFTHSTSWNSAQLFVHLYLENLMGKKDDPSHTYIHTYTHIPTEVGPGKDITSVYHDLPICRNVISQVQLHVLWQWAFFFFLLSLGSVILNRNNSCLFSRQFKVVSTDWPVECEEITSCSSSICALCCNLFVFYCCPKGGKERSKFCRRTTPEKHRSELGSASDQSQKKKISRRL